MIPRRALYCQIRTDGPQAHTVNKRKFSRKDAKALEGRFDGDCILRTYRCMKCGSYHVVKEFILRGVWINASKRREAR